MLLYLVFIDDTIPNIPTGIFDTFQEAYKMVLCYPSQKCCIYEYKLNSCNKKILDNYYTKL